MYLKFVWGRSRIPCDIRGMEAAHKVNFYSHMSPEALPQAHTCFFSVDIPRYRSEKVMRAKFLTAITLCGEIDIDGTAMTDFNGDAIRQAGGRWDSDE